MEKRVIESSRLGEKYTVIKHDSGLTICLYPMEKYSSAFAIFGTKYGSVDTVFKTDSDKDYVTVPEGIAHYLEHKLFENDDSGGAMEQFAATGASCNAYTTFDATAYYFGCTDKFGENLRILLNFVQNPYFTAESVEKERGIIGQEIKIYLDDPGWRVFFNGLNALYHNNPVRIDIAGTTESIQQIDENLLYRCYNTFYNLNNMVLSIAGRFDPDEALAICDELLKKSVDKGLSVIIPDEPEEVKEKRVVQQLYCAVPLFQLGFKKKNYEEREARRQYIIHNIMLEAALGDFSPFYSRLYDSGLINDTFSLGVTMGRGFFIPMASGESRDPDKVCEELKQELSRLKKEGIPKESFDIVKKMTYGELLSGFGTVANVAKGAMNAQFGGISLYDSLEMAADVSYEDAMTALRELDLENSSLSIIEPPEKKGEAGNV